jgi:hypothetical protein
MGEIYGQDSDFFLGVWWGPFTTDSLVINIGSIIT